MYEDDKDLIAPRRVSSIRNNKGLLVIVVSSLLLRLLWLNTLIGRDEGSAGYVGWLWLKGKILYVDVYENKGPFFFPLYGLISNIFGPSIIYMRLLNDFLFTVSIIMIYRLAKDWYGKTAGLASAAFFGVFMNAPIYEGQLAVSESVAMPLLIGSVYCCSSYLKTKRKTFLFLSGVLSSLSFLTRQSAGLISLVILTMLVCFSRRNEPITSKRSYLRGLLSPLFALFLGIVVPIVIALLYFFSNGVLYAFFDGVIVEPFAYFRGTFASPGEGGFSVTLTYVPSELVLVIIVQGLPLWVFGCLGASVAVLRRSMTDKLLLLWLILFSLVASRPPAFGHYYQQIIPPMSLLAGMLTSQILEGASMKKAVKSIVSLKSLDKTHIATVMVFALLLMTSIPSAYMHSIQFPNYNIKWEFVNWEFAEGRSYKNQTELAEYLRINTPKNCRILVHGWAPEIYWLSGFEAPMTCGWSRPPSMVPESEYKALLRSVQNLNFERVVLFAQKKEFLYGETDDPVINYTLRKYFFEKQIDNAWIFSKYDSKGRYIAVDLVDMFQNASLEYVRLNGTIGNTATEFAFNRIVIPITYILDIMNDTRYAIRQHPLSQNPEQPELMRSFVIYSPTLPEKPVLKFGVGLDPAIWNMSDGAQFRISVNASGEVQEVFSTVLNPKENLDDRHWIDYEINLSKYANKQVRIMFETLPGEKGNYSYDWAFWGTPVILNSK